jgi:DNA polymerase I-like protein with 3'-5' exonuclease and polymerase domains
VLSEFYKDGKINTPTGRHIEVDQRKALSYLIQSTTSDLTLDRAVAIDKALEGSRSKVAFIVHDEIVLDLSEEDKQRIPELKAIFENNKLGRFMANTKAGKTYGTMKELKL